MKENKHKLDVVITWVDGSDIKLQQKRQSYLTENIASDAISTTRFASQNEIYFCIASILKYMPDCGKIYLVTDQQQPALLAQFAAENICGPDKIQLIDHQVLFQGYQTYLPTFNSLSIEAMLWNIPGLSAEFIYFNDDVFINAPLAITDCFVDDQVVVYGHWKGMTLPKAKYALRRCLAGITGKKLQPRFNIAQMLSAELAGLDRYYVLDHRPHFIQTQILRHYFQENVERLHLQLQYKFRHIEQFLPTALANHLAIQQHKAILKPDIPIAYIKPKGDVAHFIQALQDPTIQYGCIQSLDQFNPVAQQQINQAMISKFKDYLPQYMQNEGVA